MNEINLNQNLNFIEINSSDNDDRIWICNYCSFKNSKALKFCPRCLKYKSHDGIDDQRQRQQQSQSPHSQSTSSTPTVGPPIGSIVNPLVIGQSNQPIHSPNLALNPSPNTSPQTLFDVLGTTPQLPQYQQQPQQQRYQSPLPPMIPSQIPNQQAISNQQHLLNQQNFPQFSSIYQNQSGSSFRNNDINSLKPSNQTQQSFNINLNESINTNNINNLNENTQKMLSKMNLPPILNTGSSGPMYMQPGDWVCQCGFVNWRRRKVCYRCYPFSNGNNSNELQKAAQVAAELANLPPNHPTPLIEKNNFNLLSQVQSNYNKPSNHPPIGSQSTYQTFLASKKAWEDDQRKQHNNK